MKKFWLRILGDHRSFSINRSPNDPKRYRILKVIGKGTFGTVVLAKDRVTGEHVAVKKIHDTPIARTELQFNLDVGENCTNIVRMRGHFEELVKKKTTVDLCLVLEYFDESLRECIDKKRWKNQVLDQWMIRIFMFHLFRGLHYLHSILGIMHRDIKPSNLMINQASSVLKISDLGSAARIVHGEARDVRVCSGPYRAPELELGNQDYDEKIDIWSAGCVMVECCTGQRLFPDVTRAEHFHNICELFGDPTDEEVIEMQPVLKNGKMPTTKRQSKFHEKIGRRLPATASELIKNTMAYRPSVRPSAMEACASAYFDPLRQTPSHEDAILFNFCDTELSTVTLDLAERVVPSRINNPAILTMRTDQASADVARTARLAIESLKSIPVVKSVHSVDLSKISNPSKLIVTSKQSPFTKDGNDEKK